MSKLLEAPKTKKHVIQSFVSGGIAGVIAKTTIAPIERIKIIYLATSEEFHYRTGLEKAIKITKECGIMSLWRGNILSCSRTFFYAAIVVSNNKRHSERTTGCGIIFQQIIR